MDIPFDNVVNQLKLAYAKSPDSENTIHTTVNLSGYELVGLFSVLGLMIDQDFVDSDNATNIENVLLCMFDLVQEA